MAYFAKLREKWTDDERAAWKVGEERKKPGTRGDNPEKNTIATVEGGFKEEKETEPNLMNNHHTRKREH